MFWEVQGVIVNINSAPADEYLGFYINSVENAPLIYINRVVSSKKAQLFTLLHEVGHRLLGEEGISNPFIAKNGVERACNAFAAEFLAPAVEFKRLVDSLGRTGRSDTQALVNAVSARSLLSRHATAIRLAETGYIDQRSLRSWASAFVRTPNLEKQEEADAAGETRGPIHAKRLGELGYLPVYAAAQAINKRLVDSIDVQAGIFLSEGLQPKAFSLAQRRVAFAVAT